MSKQDAFVPTEEQICDLQSNIIELMVERIDSITEETVEEFGIEAFIDAHGHLVLRTKKPVDTKDLRNIIGKSGIPDGWAHAAAYLGTDVITLPRSDAEAIDKILAKKIAKAGSSEEAFGDKAISAERLYDRINGTIYPIMSKDK